MVHLSAAYSAALNSSSMSSERFAGADNAGVISACFGIPLLPNDRLIPGISFVVVKNANEPSIAGRAAATSASGW